MRNLLIPMVVFSVLAIGCSTAPKNESQRAGLRTDAEVALDRFHSIDPSIGDFLQAAAGYAIFPNIGKGGLAGGAYGRGALYEHGVFVGYCDLTQGTVGAQAGGQTYSELIVFETQDALARFKSGNFTFAANASAVAAKNGAARAAKYENGVAVFSHTTGGLMAEAAVGGQKFSYVSTTDAPTPREETAKTDLD